MRAPSSAPSRTLNVVPGVTGMGVGSKRRGSARRIVSLPVLPYGLRHAKAIRTCKHKLALVIDDSHAILLDTGRFKSQESQY